MCSASTQSLAAATVRPSPFGVSVAATMLQALERSMRAGGTPTVHGWCFSLGGRYSDAEVHHQGPITDLRRK